MKERRKASLPTGLVGCEVRQDIFIYEDGLEGQQRVLLAGEKEYCDDDSEYSVERAWKWTDTI
jgi:hypothetical protein